jgi:hypothetical protein
MNRLMQMEWALIEATHGIALLIFFGKVVVYLRAMNRPLPQTIQDYIA